MLVVLVIFLFLRRFVATVIPTLSLPVSLVGAVSLLWAFGYTLDNISLLGITLAVGLVVDDAIVMLENIMRHVEDGEPPFQAALRGSREVGFTIISISSSLVAVFIPIFFMPGRDRPAVPRVRGRSSSLAIVASAFVSLTLVPMLASRFLKRRGAQEAAGRARPLVRARLRRAARRATRASLDVALRHRGIVLVVALLTFVADRVAVRRHPQGLLPGGGHRPDHGSRTEASEDTSFPAMVRLQARVADDHARRPERRDGQLVQRRPAARRTPGACSST